MVRAADHPDKTATASRTTARTTAATKSVETRNRSPIPNPTPAAARNSHTNGGAPSPRPVAARSRLGLWPADRLSVDVGYHPRCSEQGGRGAVERGQTRDKAFERCQIEIAQ